MARFLKNTNASRSVAHTMRLPMSNDVNPPAPVTGLIRFNTAINNIEFYYNDVWNQIAKVGRVLVTVDEFIGDGSTVSFTMSKNVEYNSDVVVTIGNIFQTPSTQGTQDNAYYVNGNLITFTSPPPAPDSNGTVTKIVVLHNLNSTGAA